jgi:O-antigen/teichoic acid export membrane protein
MPFVSHDELGRYVFAWSIANAVQTVAYASVVVTAGPRLAKTAAIAPQRFAQTLRDAARTLLALTVPMVAAIALLYGPLCRIAHQSAGVAGLATLGILLVSFIVRSLTDLLWAAAIALQAGRRVASGMAVLAAVCVPSTVWIIAGYGQIGVPVAHLVSSLMIALWLAWVVRRAHDSARLGPPALTRSDYAG